MKCKGQTGKSNEMQGLDWEKEEKNGKNRTVRLQDQQAGAAE